MAARAPRWYGQVMSGWARAHATGAKTGRVAVVDAPPLESRTLSGVLDDLQARGFVEHFRVADRSRLRAIRADRTFAPDQVSISEWHRFEGVSDPDDMSIVYAIETRSGVRGTLVDAFGVYSDPIVGAFLDDVGPRPVAVTH